MTTAEHSRGPRAGHRRGFPDPSPAKPSPESDRRGDQRYFRDEPVIVATEAGEVFGGVVCNRGLEGLYFESDFLVQCGVKLEIRPAACAALEDCPGLKGEVRWARKLSPAGADGRFGAGVRIHATS